MFITTRSKEVSEIVERSSLIRRERPDRISEVDKNWNYIKRTAGLESRYFDRHEYSTHQRLINEFKDKVFLENRCFLIGGGPSLKEFNFSKISNEFTIAINRAHEFIKDPSIIFFIDEEGFYDELMKGGFGQEALKKFNISQSIKISLNISGRNYGDNIYSIPISKNPEMTFDLKEGIYDGGNSGFAALNLAVCLGAKEIYLLGYDMKGDGKGRQAWFHDGYKRVGKERSYRDWIKHFKKVSHLLKQKGIRVINLNHNSELRCFEFGKIEDVRQKTITVITPTGDRPLAFALCQQWMRHQTRQPDQWIVVDDGKTPMEPSVPMQYVRREPQPNDPRHTLILNLKTAMPLIKGDKIIIMEDDEYYAPGYLAKMTLGLDKHEVIGIGKSRYYHLPSAGNFRIGNMCHASLAETGFRNSFLPMFDKLLAKNNVYLDYDMWKKAKEARCGFIFTDDIDPLYVGIKGLPGRAGIGRGHDLTLYNNHPFDKTRKTLKKWIPNIDDFNIYMDIIEEKLTDGNYQSYFPNITGITVCSNTKDLIERAYKSIRKFHPYMPIIVVDGSDPMDPCALYVKSIASDKTFVVSLGYNIGHGRGMCMGIKQAKTKYALIFDSDIEMLKSPVQAMLEMMEEDTFGVGCIEEKTAFDGFEWGWPGHNNPGEWMSYLHPFFQLIDIRNYRKYYPYVHHGAPCYLTMLDIHKRGLSGRILKQFPGLGHSSGKGLNWTGVPREHIRHDTMGTGHAHASKCLPHIEGAWVMNDGLI